ncbi:transcription termination/antitermination protein NusG [Halothermothrix orenii]|uniref:Transcription termination/antitermination protein NusG n=1 Tax=Halothermothrix orenii (strain H 168 / OCM 544 / DSM 9562) TaxID=373903 RepID=B8D0B1_HALOH|nr:transcription termination/antitermination protein NusG [Halothermothrix orenii]ACL68865.1 NusG antitermination factor [Halothermothrix orenii H 168]
MEEEKKWYVVHTYSGHENKVKANLEKRIKATDMEDKIFRILVPTEEKIESKKGKQKKVEKRIFPGYVLVEMIMTDDSWYVVRNTPGVTGFVSSGTKPLPLQPEEAKHILRGMGIEDDKIELDFGVGDKVKIVDGPFEEFIGEIKEVHPQQSKVKVLVSMFGRETPLELEFSQIEKI